MCEHARGLVAYMLAKGLWINDPVVLHCRECKEAGGSGVEFVALDRDVEYDRGFRECLEVEE
jgi:hypothetical protein